jgi:biotin carboxylase
MRFAEVAIHCDIRDFDSILRTVSSMTEKPSLIMTDQSDLAIETASYLSQHFGLPGIEPRICKIYRNKLRFRSFLESEIGVRFPRYRKVLRTSSLKILIDDLGLPFVIKPADSQSSRGFSIISSANDDFDQTIQESFKHSQLDYLLAEQFIRGTEVTIEGVSIGGQHHVLASSSKQHFRPGIASRLDFPARIKAVQLQSLVAFHNRLIEATGLENGLTHSEYLIDLATGIFSPVEIACRGGGNLISSHIVPWISGTDTHALLLDSLLGNDAKVELRNSTRCATLQFFEFQDGVVPPLPDFARLSGFPSKVISEFNVQSGQRVGLATDDRSRHGFAITLSENSEDLEATQEQIDLTFRQLTKTT